jgi:all-trans-8'-apo-beta-carotenal 15,15'-oxygenase
MSAGVSTNVGTTLPDLAPGLDSWFLFEETEDSYEIAGASGRVPEWLQGTWYINGPARFERAGMRYRHWLDGDGMVCALHFGETGMRFTNRFVATRKLQDEQAAGRFLYRGFGTAFAGDRLRRNVILEPPVNVSVYPFAGRLLALGEQTLPYDLDPVTLDTQGEYDFKGALNEVSPFSAHAKFDRGLLNFGVVFSAKRPTLNVYEFDEDGNQLRRRHYPLRYPHSMHDFGFARNRVVFFLSPFLMKFERFWSDRVSVMESLSWEPELGSRILVTPRLGCEAEPFTIEVGEGYCLHVINCFETGHRLVMDVLLLDAPVYKQYQPIPNLFCTSPRCRPVRYTIDLERRVLEKTTTLDYDLAQDFPAIDMARAGHRSSDFWVLGMSARPTPGRKFFDQLAHGSWETGGVKDIYTAPAGNYLCGEPCFIRNPKLAEEAVVICENFCAASEVMSLVLFDALNVRNGPIASIQLRRPVHPGYHTSFAPAFKPAAGSHTHVTELAG